jgi:hypothetical protein
MEEVTVYFTWDEPMADMAVGLLAGAGIHAHKIAQAPRSVYPFTMDGMGIIEVRVSKRDCGRARGIIAARFSDYRPPPCE